MPSLPLQLLNSVCMVPNEEDKKFFAKPLLSRKNRYTGRHPCEDSSVFCMSGGEGRGMKRMLCMRGGGGRGMKRMLCI